MKRIIALLLISIMPSMLLAQRVTVSGYVVDNKSGESLIGAGIVCNNPAAGTFKVGSASNNYGFYTLSLPAGRRSMTWSYIGYADYTLALDLTQDTVINIRLEPAARIEEAVVTARKEAGINSTNTGAIEMSKSLLENAPALFGEKDVLKVLQLLPGIQGGTAGNSNIYVRGGGPDENLIMLDDIPLYNVSHMMGIFSVFTPEAVKKVTLFKGSFPARYGGRVSSVIDVRTNDGNMKEFHGLVSVGLLSDRIHLEGPIVKDKTAFSFSGRVLHTFLFTPLLLLKDIHSNYYFGDINGKVIHKCDNGDRLIASIYHGRDRFLVQHENETRFNYDDFSYKGKDSDVWRLEKTDMNLDWGNTVGVIRWNHAFGPTMFANTTLAYNHYEMDMSRIEIEKGYNKRPAKDIENMDYSYDNNIHYNSGITDGYLKIDFDYNPTPEHMIKFGGGYVFHDFTPQTGSIIHNKVTQDKIKDKELDTETPEIEKQSIQDTTLNMTSGGPLYGHEASVYIEDDFVLGQRLSFNPGVHLSMFNTQGKTYLSVQPRFSGRLEFGGGFSIKASYARMAQYVHLLTSTDISLPTDLWVPITKNIKPETANQWTAGAYWAPGNGWEFSLEGYWKELKNVLEYKDGMSVLITSTDWESKVAMGQGRAYGMELFIQKKTGNTTGWLGYTLAKSERRFPDGSINRGEWFPFKYDRRHDISLVLNHKFSRRLDVSASWKFFTGDVRTLASRSFTVVGPAGDPFQKGYVTGRGNYRKPPSHTLNLGMNLHRQKRHGEGIWSIGLYNAYNSMNPDFVYSEYKELFVDSTNTYKKGIVVTKITVLPILPSLSYTRKF